MVLYSGVVPNWLRKACKVWAYEKSGEAALLKLGPQKMKTTLAEGITAPPWLTRFEPALVIMRCTTTAHRGVDDVVGVREGLVVSLFHGSGVRGDGQQAARESQHRLQTTDLHSSYPPEPDVGPPGRDRLS